MSPDIGTIRRKWTETGKIDMKTFLKDNYPYDETVWNNSWNELKNMGRYTTSDEIVCDLIPTLASHILRRHLLIVMEDRITFLSGNTLVLNNVKNNIPLFLCHVQNPKPHYQSLKSENRKIFWKNYAIKKENEIHPQSQNQPAVHQVLQLRPAQRLQQSELADIPSEKNLGIMHK